MSLLPAYKDNIQAVIDKSHRFFEERGMRWKIGHLGVSWMELWLDYRISAMGNLEFNYVGILDVPDNNESRPISLAAEISIESETPFTMRADNRI